MNWKIGQKLVCIWIGPNAYRMNHPKINEVVTCNGYSVLHPGHIFLKEYPTTPNGKSQSFLAFGFRPLVGSDAKSELVSSFTEVTETSDLPIKQPELI